MSAQLKKFAPYLRLLHKAKPKVRKAMLKKYCNDNFVRCICECAANLLKGNVRLTPAQKTQLSRRKRLLRKLVLKKPSLKSKRKIVQSGGFLGALLGPIIKIVSGLFGATS
jgi:hypothetical protein